MPIQDPNDPYVGCVVSFNDAISPNWKNVRAIVLEVVDSQFSRDGAYRILLLGQLHEPLDGWMAGDTPIYETRFAPGLFCVEEVPYDGR